MNKAELIKFSLSKFTNSYLDGISHFLNKPLSKPLNVSVGITLKCNLKCAHCDIWKLKPEKDLEKNQWMDIIESLHEWLGTFQLSFTGGEPLLYPGIYEVIEFAANAGIISSIVTSGSTLNKTKLTELLQSKVESINISLDSVNPQIHDKIRGVKGVHNKVINAIEEFCAVSKNEKVIIATVIMESNIEEIIPLAQYTEDKNLYGISYQVLTDNFGRKYDHDWYKKSKNFVRDIDKIEMVIDEIIILKNKGYPILNTTRQLEFTKQYFIDPTKSFPFSCRVGFNTLRIGPSGHVQFCNHSKPFGNILELEPDKLWKSQVAQIRRREIRHCEMFCSIQNCYIKKSIIENIKSMQKSSSIFFLKQGYK